GELAGGARAVEHEPARRQRRQRRERNVVAAQRERDPGAIGAGWQQLGADRARDAAVVDKAAPLEQPIAAQAAERDVAQRDRTAADLERADAGDREHAAERDPWERDLRRTARESDLALHAAVPGAHAQRAGDQADAAAIRDELDGVRRQLADTRDTRGQRPR